MVVLSRSEDQPALSSQDIAIEIAPRMPRAVVNGRHNILVTGCIRSSVKIAEACLMSGEAISGRIVYGVGAGALLRREPGAPSDVPDRRQYDFAFNLICALEGLGDRVRFAIFVLSETGAPREAAFELEIRPEEPGWATNERSTLQPDEIADMHSPMLLYVEKAVTDGNGQISVQGWAVSFAPVLAIQVFDGDRRLGLAKMGLERGDVGQQYPDYPGSATSGFLLSRFQDALPAGSPVRVQAVARSGNAYEIILPLAPQRDPHGEPEPPRPETAATTDAAGARITLHCDEISLAATGDLVIDGWCLSDQAPITSVRVFLDGAEIGEAELGRTRDDVAAAYPNVADALHAGFRLKRRVAVAAGTQRQLRVVAYDGTGGVREHVVALEAAADDSGRRSQAASDSCKLFVDTPALLGGEVEQPVTARLFLEGWALARDGVRSIEVDLNGMNLGPAFYGQRREDIAAAFPDWNDALLSGWAFHFPSRALALLAPGKQDVAIRLTTRTGEELTRTFSFRVDSIAGEATFPLPRSRVSWAERDLLLRTLDGLGRKPVFGVLLIAGDSAEEAVGLRQTVRSLQAQIYDEWRLTIISERTGDLAEALEAPDARIDLVSARDFSALNVERAGGAAAAFMTILRPGDELGCDAFAELAIASHLTQDGDFFYADDLRPAPGKNGQQAFYKPGWSPDLLLSGNYIGRFWCASPEVFSRAALRPETLLQAGDYDLVLRATEQARSVRHVPRVLFRAGSHTDSVSAEAETLERALRRRGEAGRIAPGCLPGLYRAQRSVPAGTRISAIIPTAGAKGHIRRCIDSIRRHSGGHAIEIICLDHIPGEGDPAKAWLREHADIVLDMPEAFNWSRFNNAGAARASGDYLLFLNDDTEATETGWLDALIEQAQRPEIGVAGPQLLYPDGKVQHAGMFLTRPGCARHAFRFLAADEPGYFGLALTQRNVIAVTGACMMMRRKTFAAMGGFDEAHAIINNDLDFCLRLHRRGLRVVYTPYAKLLHHELASRAALKDEYAHSSFDESWKDLYTDGDPYFNPNLSKEHDDYRPEDEPAQLVHAGHPLFLKREIKRILALKLDHIGDFITALPAFRRLKQHFPDAEIYALASQPARAVAPLEPSIKEVIAFDFFHERSSLGRREVSEERLRQLREELEPYRFDLAVDLRKHTDTRDVLRYTGARFLAGFDAMDEHPWLDVVLEWETDRKLHPKRQHVTDDLIRLVDALALASDTDRNGVAPQHRPQPATPDELPPDVVELFQKPVAIVHPGVGQETRQWPAAHFTSLVNLLIERSGLAVLLIGSPDEAPLADSILDSLTERNRAAARSVAGKVPLAELPRLLAASCLYVGNNSGPKHLAAAIGVPTIGIHSGVVDATEWGPLGPNAVAIRRGMTCSPCYVASLSQCIRHFACMRGLEPKTVYDVCVRMLALGRSIPAD